MKPTDRQFVSERGELLACDQDPLIPILTVELYCKWYGLYVIHPSGAVAQVNFLKLEDHYTKGSAFRGHVPNPEAVRAYAEAMNYSLEPIAEELIEGRWKMESS